MRFFADQRFLAIYSGVLTLVFAVTVLCGFAALRSQSFDQLTVHRINFVEPDGTPRLIISDRAEFPGMSEPTMIPAGSESVTRRAGCSRNTTSATASFSRNATALATRARKNSSHGPQSVSRNAMTRFFFCL